MSRVKTVFVCRDCGAETPRWEGRCPACGAWNSLVEAPASPGKGGGGFRAGSSSAAPPEVSTLGDGSLAEGIAARTTLDLGDIDRVLGGGLVPVLGGGGEQLTLRVVAKHADMWNIPGGTLELETSRWSFQEPSNCFWKMDMYLPSVRIG